jgi:pilus assembly protein Flp/PilA
MFHVAARADGSSLKRPGRIPLIPSASDPALNFSVARHIVEEFRLSSVLNKLLKDEAGATAIEYGLIVALISVAVIGAYSAVGSSLTATFNNVASTL